MEVDIDHRSSANNVNFDETALGFQSIGHKSSIYWARKKVKSQVKLSGIVKNSAFTTTVTEYRKMWQRGKCGGHQVIFVWDLTTWFRWNNQLHNIGKFVDIN